MKQLSTWVFSVALVLSFSTEVFAGNRSGTVSDLFLTMPVSARVVGLANADVATAEGVSSIAYNPAGILSISNYGFSATYSDWFAGISHSFVGAAVNVAGVGSFGISAITLSTNDMQVTTPAYPEGTGQYFRASDYAFSIAFAKQISDKFSFGLNAKYITSYLYNTSYGANAFAVDLGVLYDIPTLRTRLGIAIDNLGTDVKFINESYQIPTTLAFGAMVNLIQQETNKLIASIQVNRPNDANEEYNFGLEYTFEGRFMLRGGYKFGYDTENWAAGFGLNIDLLGVTGTLGYGYDNFKWLPGTHTISFQATF